MYIGGTQYIYIGWIPNLQPSTEMFAHSNVKRAPPSGSLRRRKYGQSSSSDRQCVADSCSVKFVFLQRGSCVSPSLRMNHAQMLPEKRENQDS